MALTFSRATALRVTMLAALAGAALAGGVATDANAAPKKKRVVVEGVPARESRGPNYSYQAGPHTRVYISRRSWLDAGTEVLPGERKFTDYAYAPYYRYGRTIDQRNQGRNPLSEPSDLGGYPMTFPLY